MLIYLYVCITTYIFSELIFVLLRGNYVINKVPTCSYTIHERYTHTHTHTIGAILACYLRVMNLL